MYGADILYIFRRCKVPICDNSSKYQSDWIENAVPYVDDKPSRCLRYHMIDANSPNTCASSNFNKSFVETCSEFVYKNEEITIVNDVSMEIFIIQYIKAHFKNNILI